MTSAWSMVTSASTRVPARGLYARTIKRAIDIVLALIGMVVFLVIFVFVAIAIKREDGGPVFYNAERIGRGFKPFKMYKFRSMKVDAALQIAEDGLAWVGDDDPRVTRVGDFLRRTSIDEVPQIVNILKGDMSFIGPRPDLREETALYVESECRRLDVSPGIGGYAQVNGRNAITREDRLVLDLQYVDSISFALDCRIFWKSIVTALHGDGIYNG